MNDGCPTEIIKVFCHININNQPVDPFKGLKAFGESTTEEDLCGMRVYDEAAVVERIFSASQGFPPSFLRNQSGPVSVSGTTQILPPKHCSENKAGC